MAVRVRSEIGTLKAVMLHRPGRELEQLVPGELERLLFEDIPYLKAAQQEHDRFAEILRENGTRVLYLEDLAAETLDQEPDLRHAFLEELISESGRSMAHLYREELLELLESVEDNRALIEKTMAGVRLDELETSGKCPLVETVRSGRRSVLDPMPNLYFTRDPFASIGEGVAVSRMFSRTRSRETVYGRLILNHHPVWKTEKRYYDASDHFRLEGGDILNLSADTLAVGISQRTHPAAVETLARRLFADPEAEIRTVLAFDIPSIRAYMHLDTVFTQVDRDKFTIHPAILENLTVYEITPGRGGELCVRALDGSLEKILEGVLHTGSVRLIRCGGQDHIASEREQWNDGSNTLCIAPGRVIVYDRNYITNRILEESGVEVLTMPGSELSRGRGGPRCMSMPLLRADAEDEPAT